MQNIRQNILKTNTTVFILYEAQSLYFLKANICTITKISATAGKNVQNPKINQYQSQGQISQTKNANVTQAEAWQAIEIKPEVGIKVEIPAKKPKYSTAKQASVKDNATTYCISLSPYCRAL